MKAKIINLSSQELNLPFEPRRMKELVKLVVFRNRLPGEGLSYPGESLLNGCVAVFDRKKHVLNKEYLGRDVGCGMLLARYRESEQNLKEMVNNVGGYVYSKHSGMGDLYGLGGAHFITFYRVSETWNEKFNRDDFFILVHSGSKRYGLQLYEKDLSLTEYFETQEKCLAYARKSRKYILKEISKSAGIKDLEVMFDHPHNYLEMKKDMVIYRKGAVKIAEGELGIIPSHMGGEAVVVSPRQNITELENSLPHATGRKISRQQADKEEFYLDGFPKSIYTPYFQDAENLSWELGPNYRELDEVLLLISMYVKIEARLSPLGTIMR